MDETWTAITYRYWGNKDEEGHWIYEEEVWEEFETEDDAWSHALSMIQHSERLNDISIICPDGEKNTWTRSGNRYDLV